MHTKAALVVGGVGDAALQTLVNNGYGPWGLDTYFGKHGAVESVFIAAGMMGVFTAAAKPFLDDSAVQWFLYGAGLDVAFRYSRIMPSLDNYYESMSVPASLFWGGAPFVAMLWLDSYLQ